MGQDFFSIDWEQIYFFLKIRGEIFFFQKKNPPPLEVNWSVTNYDICMRKGRSGILCPQPRGRGLGCRGRVHTPRSVEHLECQNKPRTVSLNSVLLPCSTLATPTFPSTFYPRSSHTSHGSRCVLYHTPPPPSPLELSNNVFKVVSVIGIKWTKSKPHFNFNLGLVHI